LNEKEELASILKKYDSTTIELYKTITKIEKENQNRIRRTEVKSKIKDAISEVIK
jgi:hypothetical protein